MSRRWLAALSSVGLVLGLSLVGGAGVASADDDAGNVSPSVTLTKKVDGLASKTIGPGDAFTYEISVACSERSCLDAELTDALPAELIGRGYELTGFDIDIANAEVPRTVTWTVDGTAQGTTLPADLTKPVTLGIAFDGAVTVPTGVGLQNGKTIKISLTLKAPSDLPPGTYPSTNPATFDWSNVGGGSKTATADVTLEVPTELGVNVSKTWLPSTAVFDPGTVGADSTITIGATNTSNDEVDTLVIQEPQTAAEGATALHASNPFQIVDLDTALGAVTLPSGADQVQVDAYVWDAGTSQYKWESGTAAAAAALPGGVAADDVAGLRFTFSNSDGTTKIAKSANASVTLPVTQRLVERDGEGTPSETDLSLASHSVTNVAEGTVTHGADTPAKSTGTAPYSITPPTLNAGATKTFTPATISKGESTEVTLTGKNTSSVPVNALQLSEGAGFFSAADKLLFDGFTSTIAWPAGVTSAKVVYHFGAAADEDVPFSDNATPGSPVTDLTSDYVAGFDIIFLAATGNNDIPVNGEATAKFRVKSDEAGTPTTTGTGKENTLTTIATRANGLHADTTSKPKLKIVDPSVDVTITKTVLPGTDMHPGEDVTVKLEGRMTRSSSYVTGKSMVFEDSLDTTTSSAKFWDAFDLASLAPTQLPAYTSLLIEVRDASGNWHSTSSNPTFPANALATVVQADEATIATAVAAKGDRTGIRLTFTSTDPIGFPADTTITPYFVATTRAAERDTTVFPQDPAAAKTFDNTAKLTGTGETPLHTSLTDTATDSESAKVRLWPAGGPGDGGFVGIDKAWTGGSVVSQSGNHRGTTLAWHVSPGFDPVTITDDVDPEDGGYDVAQTVFDAFDLVSIDSIAANSTPYTNGWYLKYDTVDKLELYSSSDSSWHEVAKPGGDWQQANGSFKGYDLVAAGVSGTTLAVRITLKPNDAARTAAANAGSDPYAPASGSGVATSNSNRTFGLTWELRNVKRSGSGFVTGTAVYNNAGDPGVVKNTASVTGFVGVTPTTDSDSDLITITDTVPLVSVAKTAKNTTAGTPGNDNPIYVPVNGGEPSGQKATFTITAHNGSVSRASYVTVMDPPICTDPQNDITACEDATATRASAVANPFDVARTDWLDDNPFDRLAITTIAISQSKAGEADLSASKVWLLSYDGTDFHVDETTAAQVNSPNAGPPATIDVVGGGTVALAEVVGISVTFQGTDPATTGGTIAQDNNLTIAITTTPRADVLSTGAAQKMGADELVSVENRAFAQSYEPVANPGHPTGDHADDTVTLTGGNLNVAATKAFNPTTLLEPNRHDPVLVTLGANPNGSELSPKRVTITDDITDSADFWNRFDLTAVTASVTPPKGANRLVISLYDGTAWQPGTAVTVNSNGSASVITLADALPSLAIGSAQGIKYVFDKTDGSYFDASVPSEVWSAQVTFSVTLRDTLRSGGALNFADTPTVIDNTVTAENWRSSTEHVDKPATAQITLSKGTRTLAVTKVANGGGSHEVRVGQSVPFTITVQNTGTGYLDLTEVRDIVPTYLAYVGGAPTYTKDAGGRLSDDVTMTPDGTDLVFTWPTDQNRMKPGETFIITVPLELQPGSSGNVTNSATATVTQTITSCTSGTLVGSNGCSASDYVAQKLGFGLATVKGVRGAEPGAVSKFGGAACTPTLTITGDPVPYYRSPCAANSVIGGMDDWVLHALNAGTTDIDKMVLIDQMPIRGDKLLASGSARGSDYRPQLTGEPVVVAPTGTGVTIAVTTGANVCVGAWTDSANFETPCVAQTWTSADLSTDWPSVTGLRISLDFTTSTDGALKANETVDVTFSTTNVVATPADDSGVTPGLDTDGIFAWNQFGATYLEHGKTWDIIAPSEVGVKLPVGSLEVSKAVTGSGTIPATFDATAVCEIGGQTVDLGASSALTLASDGTPVRIDGIPVGATCQVTENGALGSFGEKSRSSSPSNGTVTISLGGTANDPVPVSQKVTLTNSYGSSGGGGGGGVTTPPTATPTSPVTTTPVPTTPTTPAKPTIPTVVPTSGTGTTTPPPPTNVPGITTSVPEPNQCVDLMEHGFDPGETVTITVTGPDGQYTITAVADENGDVAFCLQSAVPVRVIIEVLGEHRVVVREVVLGIGGELPNTGVPVLQYLTWALLLLGAGTALVLFGRRGRKGRHFAE